MPCLSPRRDWLLLLAALLVLGNRPLFAHEGPHPHGHPPEGMPNYYYDPADETVDTALLDEPLWYDGDMLSTDDGLWYAWLEYTAGKGDQIWVGLRRDGEWIQRERVTDVLTGYVQPTLTPADGGRLWLTYEIAAKDGQWDVFALLLEDGQIVGKPRRVSPGAGTDINHDAVADGDGGLWVVWQSDRDGQFEIQARHVAEKELGEPAFVSNGPDGDWHPAVAIRADGTVLVAWDGYNGNDYDVYLRRLRDGQWTPTATVAGSPAFEGRAEIVVDQADRAWLAWEEGGKNWGKPYRGIKTTTVTDQIGPLHRFRRMRLAVIGEDGAIGVLKDALPMPSIHWAEHRKGEATDTKPSKLTRDRLGAFYERAKLAIDNAGRLWVAYRHYYTPWLGYQHRSHIEQGWGVYARCYGSDGWSKLYKFDIDQRDGMQRLEITPHGDGLAILYTTGRTDRRTSDRPRGLVTAAFEPDDSAQAAGSLALARQETDASAARPQANQDGGSRPTVTFEDQQYELFFGDLHRHTDLSLCRVAIDGTIDDAYRYAIDPGRLDFLGITDHARDIDQGQWLSHLWWRSQKEVKRHELGTDFFPFYAYERSGGTADHNIISLRDDRLRSYKISRPKFWTELGPDTIVIPHQPFRRGMWKLSNDPLRRLAEIYQGCRDNSIEAGIHRGLDKGNHVGFIASSDHMSTSASYACVWAETLSRESIFRGLQARRTYGATAQIKLVFRAGEHWMGEIFTASKLPPLTLTVTGTAPVESVTLVLDGKPHTTVHPHAVEVNIQDELDLSGSHYLYYHLVQSDGNEAWSSPIWVTVPEAGE